MKLSFFGADHCVTGSCHCLEVNGKKILIDCGLQQGRDEIDNSVLPFNPAAIDAVLVTHGGVIAALMEHLFPQENKNRYQWQSANGGGYRLEYWEKIWGYRIL